VKVTLTALESAAVEGSMLKRVAMHHRLLRGHGLVGLLKELWHGKACVQALSAFRTPESHSGSTCSVMKCAEEPPRTNRVCGLARSESPRW